MGGGLGCGIVLPHVDSICQGIHGSEAATSTVVFCISG